MTISSDRGFTLIELLVVIAIIALIASFAAVSFQRARQKALATKVITDFRQFETAFRLLADEQGRAVWWKTGSPTDELGCGWQASLSCIAANQGLDAFIQAIPNPPVGTQYTYHNSANFNQPAGCPGVDGQSNAWHGATLSLRDVPQNSGFVELVDNTIDGGDGGGCGKIKWNQSGGSGFWSLYWMMAPNSVNF